MTTTMNCTRTLVPAPASNQNATTNNAAKKTTLLRLRQVIDYEVAQVEVGDPFYKLDCPTDIVKIRADLSPAKRKEADKNIDLVLKQTKYSWLKDGKPLKSRLNGNFLDKFDNYLILYQTGASDQGTYTCLADYCAVPQHLWDLYIFYKGATLPIEVPRGLPDIEPHITDPPRDAYVPVGATAQLTCTSVTTLSISRTTWYKSCPFSARTKNSTKCLDDFMTAYDNAVLNNVQKPLTRYLIDNNDRDVLVIKNVTEKETGHYVCAVQNSCGIDMRLAKVALPEDWPYPARAEPVKQQPAIAPTGLIWLSIGISSALVLALLLAVLVYVFKISMKRDKKQNAPLISSSSDSSSASRNSRQRLPTIEAPDIYNTGKSIDGFISGHFCQEAGHLMAQSICSNLLNKVNPSISSSNSHQSDEASSSWGKSTMSSAGDHSRTFYSPASNATATTVPLYDHPPSTRAVKSSNKTFVQGSCVSNPSYWLLNHDHDKTEWSFPRRNLERVDKIGEGQFGEVWRYIARNKDGSGNIVAVKRLKDDLCASNGERSELRAEIEIMKAVNNHPNVIKLLHCCIDDCGPILLIMEYAEHGKLQTYLRSCRSHRQPYGCLSREQPSERPNITSKELIKFTYHIAKGMEYVASLGIVHRDLASRNILVSKDKISKVADFGFARRVDEECVYVRKSTNPVPVKWMAPEALEGEKFTFKSDVFSLGVLMWEIVTLGATPYEQMSSEGVYKKVTTGGRLERPPHCRDEFFTLMDQCWTHDAALRPTFKEVAEQLEKLLLSENDYIELDQYPEHAYYNIVNGAEKEIVQLST